MGLRRLVTLTAAILAALLIVAAMPAFGGRESPRLVIGKGNLVAPLRIPAHPHPGAVPSCRRGKIRCVRTTIRRLRGIENRLGCDHRAVFATTYRVLTQVALETVRSRPGFLRFRRYFFFEDGLFADIYAATVKAWPRGKRVSPAWRIAFEAAESGDLNAAQDMLLAINAHVQNDMPFLLAALGTHTRKGVSRKPDHDRENKILEYAYQRVVDAVERRYDPIVGFTNPDGVPADDAAGLELVRGWREEVWRNARRLLTTRKDPGAHAEVVRQIESNAANFARVIADREMPGYRAQRDAYCQEQRG